jgi:hypothetical protein
MRPHLLAATVLLSCSSFLNEGYLISAKPGSSLPSTANYSDFTVRRLSGDRVFVSWHTENESPQVIYEVLRKHSTKELFASLGVVQPKLKEANSAEYTFTDTNDFSDSSYYCLKKTNVDSVIFYSITKAVEGVGKDR